MMSTVLSYLSIFAANCDKPTFLGLVPWYQYLDLAQDPTGTGCRIVNFDSSSGALGAQSPFLLIGLAILENLIRIAGLVAVGYIIYGGFRYMTSQGSPDSTKGAQQTIINALIGVVIAIVAAAGVAYLGNRLAS